MVSKKVMEQLQDALDEINVLKQENADLKAEIERLKGVGNGLDSCLTQKIEVLVGLDRYIINALHRSGFTLIGQLCLFSEAELSLLRCLGKSGVIKLKRSLTVVGVDLYSGSNLNLSKCWAFNLAVYSALPMSRLLHLLGIEKEVDSSVGLLLLDITEGRADNITVEEYKRIETAIENLSPEFDDDLFVKHLSIGRLTK